MMARKMSMDAIVRKKRVLLPRSYTEAALLPRNSSNDADDVVYDAGYRDEKLKFRILSELAKLLAHPPTLTDRDLPDIAKEENAKRHFAKPWTINALNAQIFVVGWNYQRAAYDVIYSQQKRAEKRTKPIAWDFAMPADIWRDFKQRRDRTVAVVDGIFKRQVKRLRDVAAMLTLVCAPTSYDATTTTIVFCITNLDIECRRIEGGVCISMTVDAFVFQSEDVKHLIEAKLRRFS